ncbi:mandelate racemase/muconate lactonizing enzyme family protein [Oricola cellulosilytica]|uniref:Mandelate racemase/muconate lactonizing enzyme family protein n=1 Tax=Oricola cellulosilytica TaxID=1429082 RepID=A0A4V2MNZ1_9HYPH|nr:mandelate racemase/muconate lactonizing enzyme family protein [Oricola cellulosilytica]TCD15297.1 mandelate racemase/muconate lactonizing enzyme family protein [Oricola cellulosilytica]
MQIKDVETFVVGTPEGTPGGRYFLFVKLTTDGGVSGWGEAYGASFGPHTMAAMIEDAGARHLVGHDPHEIEALFRRCYSSGFSQRPDLSMMGCYSALEMACWDIIGKEAGKPVHALIGGRVHEALRSYTYLYPATGSIYPDKTEGRSVYNEPELAAENAEYWVRQGFTAVKFDPAGPYTIYDPHQPLLTDIERSAQMMKAVREAVGSRADILFGTHGQFTPSGAARMARAIERYDPLWFEEPVPPDMPEAMAEFARKTSIPVATGERLTTKYEFARLLALGAAQIIQPDLGRSGGILEGKKIAALAEVHHAQVAPHCYCGPVTAAANIQLAATLPNFLLLEAIKDWGGFHAELLKTPLRVEDGYTIVPDEPGLGIEVDEAVARAHPYDGPDLHLSMADRPVQP